jgi:hypothetical protein
MVTISKDSNGNIIKTNVSISTTPSIVNNSAGLGTVENNTTGTINSLKLNGTSVTSTGAQINYMNVTPGTAASSKAIVLNEESSISNINALSCASININGHLVTGSNLENVASGAYLSDLTPGTASASKAAVLDSSSNINGINSLSTNQVSLSGWNLTTSGKQNSLNSRVYSSNTLSNTNQWNSICWSNRLNLFVAVSSSGTSNRVMTSSDSINWTLRTSASNNNWTSVCWSYDLTLFVAVASSGTGNRVMTSPDGINWTSQNSSSDNNWTSVCWSPELTLFVAVASSGTNNRVMTSPDGITWTSQTSASNNNWTSVCWSQGQNIFVAVASSGTGNRVMTSSDGITWTSRTSAADNNWTSVCWGINTGLFIAVSNTGTNNRVMVSSNGINWRFYYSLPNNNWNSIIWCEELNVYVAIASAGANNKIAFSSNGYNWISSSTTVDNGLSCIVWSPYLNIFSILTIQYSDLVNPTTILSNWNTSTPSTQLTKAIRSSIWISDLNLYIISGATGLLMTSSDGINWTTRTVPVNNNWNSLEWSSSLQLLVAVSNSGTASNSIMTSPDGINWTSRTAPYAYNWVSVCWSSSLGMFAAVSASSADTNVFMTSTNGINWTARTGTSSTWSQIIWSSTLSLFVVVSSASPYIMTSSNGTSWTTRTPSTSTTWKSIAWSPSLNLFVAVADSGTTRVMTSPDGINWTNRTSQITSQWCGVIWSSSFGVFVAVSSDTTTNYIMYSSDGINWNTILSNINNIAWNYISYSSTLNTFLVTSNTANVNNIMKTNNFNNLALTSSNSSSLSLNLSEVISSSYPTIGNIKNVLNNLYNVTSSLTYAWTNIIVIPQLYNNGIYSFINNYYISCSPSGLAYSLDCVNWTTMNAVANNWNSLAWSPTLNLGVAVASSGSGNRMLTINTYQSVTSSNFTNNNNWTSVCWSSDLSLFVAVASSGFGNRVAISYNAKTWVLKQSAVDNNWTSVCWSSELSLFVAVSSSGSGNRIMTSSDGMLWLSQTSPADNNWTSVCWSPELNLFIAVASSGTGNRIMSSVDGINWTTQTSPANNNWTSVIYVPDLYLFIACASSGTQRVMYSTDGIKWTLLTTPYNNSWQSICWDTYNNRLVIVSSDGSSNNIIKSNIFKPTSYNSITGGLFTINDSNGYVSLNTFTTPTYQFEYTDNLRNGLFFVNKVPSTYVFYTVDNTGTCVLNSNNGVQSLNIVNHNGSTSGLALNGTLITASADNLNSISKLTLGTTAPYKAISANSSLNIIGLNQVSCTTLNTANVFVSVTPGSVVVGLPCITDSSNNIGTFNNMSGNILTLKGNTIKTYQNPLLNNGLFNSIINFTNAEKLNSYNNVKNLLWIPELNKAVAVQYNSGSGCYISTSSDGIIWNTTANQINVISFCSYLIWSPSLQMYIALTITGSSLAYSYNLTTWTTVTGLSNGAWYTGCWSTFANLFVIFNSGTASNSIYTSTNGTNWTARGGPNTTFLASISVADSINLIIGFGSNTIYYSSNGINWSNRNISFTVGSVAYSSSLGLLVGVSSAQGNTIVTSTDGINWTIRTLLLPASSVLYSIAWSSTSNIFLAVSNSTSASTNPIMVSKDGINWIMRYNYTSSYIGVSPTPFTSVVWAASLNRFLFTSSGGYNSSSYIGYTNNSSLSSNFYSKTDVNTTIDIPNLNKKTKKTYGSTFNGLSNWYARTSSADISWKSICWASNIGLFVSVGSSSSTNGVMTSSDGKNWTERTSASNNNWTSICWSSSLTLFVVVASSGTGNRVMTSSDGINWASQTSSSNNNWTSVCWSPELTLFVAVASSGTSNRIMTSPDGINWTSRTSPIDNNWTSVCWSPELTLFAAVASSGTGNRVITSSDGINWTSRTSAADNNWTSVCWSSDMSLFVSVASSGNNNRVMTSLDGITWFTQYSAADYNWVSVIWAIELNCAIAISNNSDFPLQNAIMISKNCYDWTLINYTNSTCWTNLCWSPDYAMFVAITNTGTGNRVLNSKFLYNTYKNTVIANPNFITVDNANYRTGLGITPTYQLHLSSDSAAKPATSTWTVSSDQRLKNNIQDADLDLCYNNVNNLRLTKYTWKDEVYTSEQVADRSKLGWIAQEVEQIFPKAVEKQNMHGYEDCRTLNNDQIIASLYGCIQKLMKKCENRQTSIDQLKVKYVNMLSTFDTLEFVNE